MCALIWASTSKRLLRFTEADTIACDVTNDVKRHIKLRLHHRNKLFSFTYLELSLTFKNMVCIYLLWNKDMKVIFKIHIMQNVTETTHFWRHRNLLFKGNSEYLKIKKFIFYETHIPARVKAQDKKYTGTYVRSRWYVHVMIHKLSSLFTRVISYIFLNSISWKFSIFELSNIKLTIVCFWNIILSL